MIKKNNVRLTINVKWSDRNLTKVNHLPKSTLEQKTPVIILNTQCQTLLLLQQRGSLISKPYTFSVYCKTLTGPVPKHNFSLKKQVLIWNRIRIKCKGIL